MIIKSKIRNYEVEVIFSFDFLTTLNVSNAFYVFDKKVFELYTQQFDQFPDERVFLLDAKEENKTIDTALKICEQITALPTKRNTLLVSMGGGIVQDVTGFVANIMYRGIDWVFLPTTLLASSDSCIGSKTSINYKSFKNLLGTFYPPVKIYINPCFFDTLSEKDYLSGLGEIIKFNVMSGNENLEMINNDLIFLINRDSNLIVKYLMQSLDFKRKYIEKDEFDKNERIYLNFAHTFGHAIEVTSSYRVPHGTAVAIGMSIANRISVNRGILIPNIAHIIDLLVFQIVKIELERTWFDVGRLVEIIRKDKKQTSNSLTAIIMDNSFDLHIVDDLSINEIEKSVTFVLDLLRILR